MTDGLQIMSAFRTPERQSVGECGLCARERPLVFDLTAGAPGRPLEVLSACEECAPRAQRLMAWIGRVERMF